MFIEIDNFEILDDPKYCNKKSLRLCDGNKDFVIQVQVLWVKL
jgi:hypothetical protein